MGKLERVQNSMIFEPGFASDSLKGILMDKGPEASHGQLYFLLNKLRVCKTAIKDLCNVHNREIAKNYGNRFLSLHYFESAAGRVGTGYNKFVSLDHVNEELKPTCYAHWLIKVESVNVSGGQLVHSNKAFPFQPAHPSHELLRDILLTHAPRYYEAIAAVENVRITLNSLYATIKASAQSVMAANAVSGHHEPMSFFTAQNRREAENLYTQLDKTGELKLIAESLFKNR